MRMIIVIRFVEDLLIPLEIGGVGLRQYLVNGCRNWDNCHPESVKLKWKRLASANAYFFVTQQTPVSIIARVINASHLLDPL